MADGNDPYLYNRGDNVKVYDVYVRGRDSLSIQTHDHIVNTIRATSSGYGNYGVGCDCHTLQNDVVDQLGWTLRRRD